nr:nacht domain protein [Colletotrichum truncatum]KAF6785122.1 nacht domain protein [Colletotrichum truncatum]
MVSGRDSLGDTIARSLPAVSRLIVGSEHTNRDLALFAKDILREKQEEGEWEVGDQSLINEILDVISIGGEGMFLWAFLTIEDICTRRNDDEVREALLDIPRNLPETFDRALRRIDQKGNTEIAQSVFKWTAAVNSPLTLSQFAEVLKIKINQRSSQESQRINGINRLPAWCENLVQVEEGSETVHFSHHSISAYLLGSTEKPNHLFNLDLRDCDGFVGEICLTYLNFSDFQRALAGRPHDNLTPTTPNNVPHKVVDRTVESLMAKKYGKGIARLIKMQFKESQPLSLGRSAMPDMSSADGLSDTNMTRDYPFLRYAKENWPWHTRNISTSSRTWRLWNNIDASADYAPWTNLDWNPPGIPRRDFSSLLSGATEILVRPPYECDIRLRFALHRAFAYADLLDHHPLVDKVISTLVDNGLNLKTVLLEMLLQSVLAQDLPLGSKERYQEEQRAHHRLVCSVTGFIARGGKTWPSSYVHQDENIGFPKSCDTWRHKGIYQDVCAIVRGHPSGVDIPREMQLYAKLSTMDLHEEAIIEFQKDVREHFKDRPRLSIIPTGDFHARGFVDIAIQRGGPGSAKLVRWLLNEAGDLSDLSPQEVLSFLNTALIARNEDALEALLDENKLAKSHSFQSIQETTVLHALRDMWLPRELRKRFITFCIPLQRYADDHVAGCAGRSLLKAVLCDAWDFAVALRRCGGSLADGEITKHKKLLPNTEATCRLFDAVLDCAASQSAEVWHCDLRQSPEVATQWLAYCPAHRTQASQVLQSYKLLDHDPMQNDPERLLDALRRTYFTTRHVKPCRGFVIGDDSNRK